MASALALFLLTPNTECNLLPTEPGLSIIQGNYLLAINAPITEKPKTFTTLLSAVDLELRNKVIAEIYKYDWPTSTALAIANCESGYNPRAFNPETASKLKGITTYSSYGVFQLNRAYDERYYDYKYNIAQAFELYLRRGWQPWTCYKNLIKTY